MRVIVEADTDDKKEMQEAIVAAAIGLGNPFCSGQGRYILTDLDRKVYMYWGIEADEMFRTEPKDEPELDAFHKLQRDHPSDWSGATVTDGEWKGKVT